MQVVVQNTARFIALGVRPEHVPFAGSLSTLKPFCDLGRTMLRLFCNNRKQSVASHYLGILSQRSPV
jgi:hypothetical protein